MSTALVVMKVTSLLHRVNYVRYMRLDLFSIPSICSHLNACGCKGKWLYCIVLYIVVIDRAVQDNSGLLQFDKEERQQFYDSVS
jgi:hypothetical protein